jgi:hypothetical protein
VDGRVVVALSALGFAFRSSIVVLLSAEQFRVKDMRRYVREAWRRRQSVCDTSVTMSSTDRANLPATRPSTVIARVDRTRKRPRDTVEPDALGQYLDFGPGSLCSSSVSILSLFTYSPSFVCSASFQPHLTILRPNVPPWTRSP